MEKNFGIRFTDDMYATKDDVKKALNMSSIDSIWDKVISFRAYYTRQIELNNVERIPFSVVLPPKITSRIVSLEKKLSKLLIKYSLGAFKDENQFNSFKNQAYFNILSKLGQIYEINTSEDTINAIISETLSTLPVEYLFLSHYYDSLRYIETRTSGSFSPLVILSLYARLRGIELDLENVDAMYRTSDLLDRNDHVFVGQHYEAAPLDRIKEMMESLCEFLNNSELFSLAKASIAYFMINYIKPFEYYNEEMALLVFKYVLAKEDFEFVPSLLPLEDLLSQEYEKTIKYLSKESEMKLDMTYLMNFLVEHLHSNLKDFEQLYQAIDNTILIQETYGNMKPSKPSEPKINQYDVEFSSVEGVSFKQTVSLPTMPVGLDEKDANMVARNLLEIYPSMKRNQAEFYSRHCTVGKYYTISQFKKEQGVAYETARTSMDNLVNLGFYKKEQIKNKFVYTPVVKK